MLNGIVPPENLNTESGGEDGSDGIQFAETGAEEDFSAQSQVPDTAEAVELADAEEVKTADADADDKGEETPDDGEQPKTADVKDITAADDTDAREPVAPEVIEQAKAVYQQDEAAAKTAIDAEIQHRLTTEVIAPAQTLHAEYVKLSARIQAINDAAKDDDWHGGYRPLTAIESDERDDAKARIREIAGEANRLINHQTALESSKTQRIFGAQVEATIKANQLAHPILKEYDAEYRQLMADGHRFGDSAVAIGFCKVLRAASGGQAAPSVTKAEATQQTLQRSIQAKNKAKIGAGSGGSGSGNIKSQGATEPAHIAKLWSKIESYPTKQRKTA